MLQVTQLCMESKGWFCIPTIWNNTVHLTNKGRDKIRRRFECIFVNENVWMNFASDFSKSLKFVHQFRITNIQAFVQIGAWLRPGVKSFQASKVQVRLLPLVFCRCCPSPKVYVINLVSAMSSRIHKLFMLTIPKTTSNICDGVM